jgi:ribosomal-protein-alanine N-acetyltransferase
MINLKKKKIKIFSEDKKISLRRLFDIKYCSNNYQKWLSDEQINRFLEVRFKKISKKEIKENIKESFNSNNQLLMGIYLTNGVRMATHHVGNIKAQINLNHLNADISIIIGENNFNRKIGSKSIKIFSEYLFNKLKLQKLSAGAYEQNIYSLKAFKSVGFKFGARLVKNRIFNGKRCDEIYVYKLNKQN